MPNSARDIVRDVIPRRMADEIWSARYDKALPISFNAFELSAVLPAVFYMFRFGQRRGQGEFLKTFAPDGVTAPERRRAATIERVAGKLSTSPDFDGFDGDVEQAILGDLLLCFCLENARHDLGRDKQIQRVAPAHYMASWIDLPLNVANLRHVPEMIGCNSEIDSSCSPCSRKRHYVVRGDDLVAIGLGEQCPGLVESRTLH